MEKFLQQILYVTAGAFLIGATIFVMQHSPARASEQPYAYWGAFVENNLSSLSDISSFESLTGKNVSIIHVFSAWGSSTGQDQFQETWLNTIRSHGAIPMVTWEPWKPTDPATNQPNYQLADIIGGTYDTYITEWALDAKAWGHPLFLRFAHEMNGNWYPWAESVNSNVSGEYIQAWRHVHDIFTANGVTNITWVWCPNKNFSGSTDIDGLYPGDAYVDWTCMDGYNRGTNGGNTWQTFDELFLDTYDEIMNITTTKPMMIGETGTVEEGGSKANWFTETLGTVLQDSYPNIRAFVYFNKFKVYDNRIQTSQSSIDAFAVAVGDTYYAANNYGSLTTSPIRPPSEPADTYTIYAQDYFGRTVSNNWNSADTGGAYTLSGNFADFDVNGSAGTMVVNGAGTGFLRSATLNDVSVQNVDLTVRIKTDKVPVGSSEFIYLLARSIGTGTGGDQYRGRLRIDTGGNVHLQAARRISGTETFLGSEVTNVTTYTLGESLTLRMQVEGTNPTTIRLKGWRSEDTEPTSWQYTVEDSSSTLQTAGGVGLHVRLNNGATNAPVVFTLDDFVARSINPLPTSTPVPTNTPQPSGSPVPSGAPSATTGSSSSSEIPRPPSCNNQKPGGAPDLFQVSRNGESATVHFAPPGDPYSYFFVSYGETPSAEGYSAEFQQSHADGAISYQIHALQPSTTYYFKVRAGNGCMPGDWSGVRAGETKDNLVRQKTLTSSELRNSTPDDQKPSSADSQSDKSSGTSTVTTTVTPTTSSTPAKNTGFWKRVTSFFSGLFE